MVLTIRALSRMDIHENTETNVITATFELPGLRKEDVSIDVHKNRLIISGETNFAADKEEGGFVVKERRRGKFSRSLPLPQNIQVCCNLRKWRR